MSEPPRSSPNCPRCGAPLAPTASLGALCPRCLLEQGLAASDPSHESEASAKTPPPAPPELAELAPLFPELEILELLGQGGMGAVYKARQRALGRLVALKILTPRPGHEAGFEARFEREAHALARLSHPNVVGIHDSGRTQGRCWLLMEYVEGVNLRQLLRSEDLGVPRALAIVRRVCDALEFAHAEGIVHRDIKPENVLVDKRGRVKIADFGLAKIVGDAEPGEPITRTQQSMGTPQYMAPEQLTGSPNVDHRADIYSLGVVFYELLTGELPLGRFEPPSQRVQVDVRLDEVVLRALEREPARRYQHATELKTGIEELDQPAPAVAPRARAPASDPPWMFQLLAVVAANILLNLAISALGLDQGEAERLRLASAGTMILVLLAAAWIWRKDRRGALLQCGLAVSAGSLSLAGIHRSTDLVPWLELHMGFEPRPADLWIVRLLLVLAGVELLRAAWSARRALRGRLVYRGAARFVDLWLVAIAALAWIVFQRPWHGLQDAQFGVPLIVALLCMADQAASWRPSTGPQPREWLRRRIDERRGAEEPAQAPPTSWLRGLVAPVLVAASAWVMSAYASSWGGFGILASSLVLALAVAGYLQQAIAPELVQELQLTPRLQRGLRGVAAVLLLSIGAIGIGAAARASAQRVVVEPVVPSWGHLVHLAELVSSSAPDPADPLRGLSQRIQHSEPTSRATSSVPFEERDAMSLPDAFDGALLVLLAPAVLLWTRRWGSSWNGCWRHSFESLLIVLAGYALSLPANALLRSTWLSGSQKPLVLEASFPFAQQRASEGLRKGFEAEGYSVLGSQSRLFSDEEGGVLLYEVLHVSRPAGAAPLLECEVAGDVGHWGSAVRLDAGTLSGRARERVRGQLTRVLQQTRRD